MSLEEGITNTCILADEEDGPDDSCTVTLVFSIDKASQKDVEFLYKLKQLTQ